MERVPVNFAVLCALLCTLRCAAHPPRPLVPPTTPPRGREPLRAAPGAGMPFAPKTLRVIKMIWENPFELLRSSATQPLTAKQLRVGTSWAATLEFARRLCVRRT